MTRTVFYVDDEVLESEHYREHLEREFRVVHVLNVYDDEIELFMDKIVAEGPALLIQDVQLPRRQDGEININRGTEILLQIKEVLMELHIPVIVFSNRIVEELTESVVEVGFPDSMIKVLFKPNIGFPDLLREARELIRRNGRDGHA